MRKASEEKCLIETERYRDNDNLPTCSRDHANNKVCEFLMTKQMGTKFVCFYDMDKKLHWRTKDGKRTYLEPNPTCCRLWMRGELTKKD